MKCHDLQMMIPGFIEKRLTDQQLEIFLDHIAGCGECYDELEVYYMITTGLMLLDENHTGTLDLKRNLRNFIEEQRRGLWLRKRAAVRKKRFRVFLLFLLVCLIMQSGYILITSEKQIRSIDDFRIAARDIIQEYLLGREGESETIPESEDPVECRMNFERMHPLIPSYFNDYNIRLPEPEYRSIFEKDG